MVQQTREVAHKADSQGKPRRRSRQRGKVHSMIESRRVSSPPASVMEGNQSFEVRCQPPDQRHALVATAGISASIRQRIRRNNQRQMWESVTIRCLEESDGTLAVRVFVSNPDWDELLQIAHIRSRPDDPASMTPLGCNLDHVAERQS
jgi:hypothetical protein